MSRRTHALLALVFVAFAMAASACAESTAPSSNVSADATCDWQQQQHLPSLARSAGDAGQGGR